MKVVAGALLLPSLVGATCFGTDTTSLTGLSSSDAWTSGALGADGKIYGLPYQTASVLIIDPDSHHHGMGTLDTTSLTGLSTSDGWKGAVLAANGNIYGVPQSGGSVLVIDPEAGTLDTSSLTGLSHHYTESVLAPSGKIYGIPGSGHSVLVIDPAAGTLDTSSLSGIASGMTYGGGALADDGKIYCVPYSEGDTTTAVLVIDPVAETVDTTSLGGIPQPDDTANWWTEITSYIVSRRV
jgi:hypothetical protein